MLLQQSNQSVRVSTDKLISALSILEQQKGRHGANTKLLRRLGDLIDINLDKVDALVLVGVGVFLEDGGDGLARTAPFGEAVDEDDGVAGDGLLELGVAVNVSRCVTPKSVSAETKKISL